MKSFKIFSLIAFSGIVFSACSPENQDLDSENLNSLNDNPDVQEKLLEIKEYSKDNVSKMWEATDQLRMEAENYFSLLEENDFDYLKTALENRETLDSLTILLQDTWLDASLYYELNEGIVAGTPSLAEFDVLLDAGPSGEEDPVEALDWTLELADGREFESPGNIFHSLLEPTLWGSDNEDFSVYLEIEDDVLFDEEGTLDGGSFIEIYLPDAYMLLAAAEKLHQTTEELQTALDEWQPTLEDTFTALVTMTPTMNEYFEQWQASVFVSGTNSDEESFVAVSRLFDITGILEGLMVAYEKVSPLVVDEDSALDQKIDSGFETLDKYVSDLYDREIAGEKFTAEEAEEYGAEAQSLATDLAGEITQAAELLEVEITE